MAEDRIHDEHGRITRYGVQRAIAEGGSVLWTNPQTGKRQMIQHERNIPPAHAFVAPGDTVAATRAVGDLDAQIAALQAQRQLLATAPAKTDKPAESDETPTEPEGDKPAESDETPKRGPGRPPGGSR